jgi:hypothetical protein
MAVMVQQMLKATKGEGGELMINGRSAQQVGQHTNSRIVQSSASPHPMQPVALSSHILPAGSLCLTVS